MAWGDKGVPKVVIGTGKVENEKGLVTCPMGKPGCWQLLYFTAVVQPENDNARHALPRASSYLCNICTQPNTERIDYGKT